MQTTSATYATALAADNHTFEVKLNIADPNNPSDPGVDYGMDEIFSLSTDSRVFDGSFSIGISYSATCEFSIIPKAGTTIPRMAKCTPYFRVTDGVNTSEWIKKGVFYIDTRETTSHSNSFDVMDAFCYDAMMMANKPYSNSSLTFPATDINVLTEIAGEMGVGIDSATTSIISDGYTLGKPSSGQTLRDYLSYIAVMYGGNFIISDDGELRFIFATGGFNTLNIGSSLASLSQSVERDVATSVRISVDDIPENDIVYGLYDTAVLEAFCPYATDAMASDIYYLFEASPGVRWKYRPFTASNVWSDPAIEVGDYVNVSVNGVTGLYVAFSRTINFGAGMAMTLSAPNDADVDHENIYIPKSDSEYNELSETAAYLSDTMSDGLRNLIINTKVPSVTNLPALYGQLGVTYFQNYTPTPAVHGIRLTKDTSSSSSVLFAFGETSNTSMFASMCGLEAGGTYTLSFDLAYTLFAASSDETYMRWRLLSWDGTTSGDTLTRTEFLREKITRNTATTKPGVKGTFTVPEDAVVLCVYMDFVTTTGGVDTVIANSAVRSTDYYEFANLKMQKGVNATEWTAAPEDDNTLEGVTTFIDSSGIDSAQINTGGLSFFDSLGNVTASYNADRANNLVTKTGTSVSLASATSGMANLTSFKLTPGLWIVMCIARFASNSTGYRYALISTSATGTSQINDTAAVIVPPANGNTTRVPLVTAINVTASTTYYLNARQNSGSALSSYGYVIAVKVS